MLTEQKAFRIDKLSIIFFDETNQHSVSVLIDMKENSKLGSGKDWAAWKRHGCALPEIVEARAREIALIDERDPDEFTDADWEQARRELSGTAVPLPPGRNRRDFETGGRMGSRPSRIEDIEAAPGGWMKRKKRSASISSPTASKKLRTIKCSRRARKNSSRRAESFEPKRGRHSDETAAAETPPKSASSRTASLLLRFHEVRDFTTKLSANLAAEDCVVQSMPDVSPAKWHLAHTTWFFETFVLKKVDCNIALRSPITRIFSILTTMPPATCTGATCAD